MSSLRVSNLPQSQICKREKTPSKWRGHLCCQHVLLPARLPRDLAQQTEESKSVRVLLNGAPWPLGATLLVAPTEAAPLIRHLYGRIVDAQ